MTEAPRGVQREETVPGERAKTAPLSLPADESKQTRYQLAYQESQRNLTQQAGVLDNLRTHAGLDSPRPMSSWTKSGSRRRGAAARQAWVA